MISSAWSLISSSAEVITGARRMTLRIHRLLQPGLIELSESDRRRLFSLQKRVECLVQPLNFLLLWSKKRDSCVHQVVLNAQELLFDVCTFVERFTPQDGVSPTAVGGKAGGPGGGSIDSDQLEYYLRELEFACASVSMAVSIAKATEAPQPSHFCDAATNGLPQTGESSASGSVSLSALLRASRRIQEMRGRSGDLCACPGRLYAQVPSSSSRSGGGSIDDAARSTAAESSSESLRGEKTETPWQPMFSLATFKVVAAIHGRLGRRYSLQVESRLPLSQRDSPRLPPTPPPEISAPGADGYGSTDVAQRGLNAHGPLCFPIEVALEAYLRTTAHVSLPTEPTRCSRHLGIDSLVLFWSDGSRNSSSAASGSTAGGGIHVGGAGIGGSWTDEATTSCEFPDAVLLPDSTAEGAPQQQRRPSRFAELDGFAAGPATVIPSPPRGGGALGGASGSSFPGQTCYAFVFEGPRGIAEARSGEAEVTLTPLDAMYLARLCALDDGQQQWFQQDTSGDCRAAASCPPHLLTSDEVLVALLQDMEGGLSCESAGQCVDEKL